MDTAKQITVIETKLKRLGDGNSSASPIRIVTQYWTVSGELIAETDPCAAIVTPEKLYRIRALVQRLLIDESANVICKMLEEEIKPGTIYEQQT